MQLPPYSEFFQASKNVRNAFYVFTQINRIINTMSPKMKRVSEKSVSEYFSYYMLLESKIKFLVLLYGMNFEFDSRLK